MSGSTVDFCKSLPKIELHAHLNGSLSGETLKKLHEMKEGKSDDYSNIPDITDMKNLEECFKVFSLAHSLTSTLEGVRVATRDVIREFAEDGVIHLELRTTPREVEGVMSREEYVQAVVMEAIREGPMHNIAVKVLLSVDRRQSIAAAEETLRLALAAAQRWPGVVVGLDLSGDPQRGRAQDFLPVLEQARAQGLHPSAHCAEVPNEEETLALLRAGVAERLGHCTCAAPPAEGGEGEGGEGEGGGAWAALRAARLPVEACLSSNVRCGTVAAYAVHHFGRLRAAGHPVALCTDDKGVFATTLSKEYCLAAEHFALTREDLWKLSYDSVQYTFCSEDEKEQLRTILLNWKKTNESYFNLECKF